VKNELGILQTSDLTSKNDRFIMAAARGDVKTFENCLAQGQVIRLLIQDVNYPLITTSLLYP
jgi:hypothetical protein